MAYQDHLHPFSTSSMQLDYLLERPPASFDREALNALVSNQTVLITGAGGSIGRELSLQVARLNPKRLVLVDFSEFNLFHLEYSMRRAVDGENLSFELVDIRDTRHVALLFEAEAPQIVFHAAAYKHVPMMEQHPFAALQNNTLASVNLLRTSERHHVDQFIFISTDKAVEPTSIMGCTKRLTEWYVRAANGTMRAKTVRFGNVFGSLGSVVPLFAEQIAAGGPVTVTTPDMERFFMSVHDACTLILQTLLYEAAPVYTLRMDPPIKIEWLAEQMIRVLAPQSCIDIEYVGKRPGEKIQEQLWAPDETLVQLPHRDILGLSSPAHYSRPELDEWLNHLETLATANKEEALRSALFQAEFICENDG